MQNCKPVLTPMQPGLQLSSAQSLKSPEEVVAMKDIPYVSAVGALVYLATASCPDIAHTVSTLCQFNNNPRMEHWKSVKHLMHCKDSASDGCQNPISRVLAQGEAY